MNIEDYANRKDEIMKKQIVSSIILIMIAFMLGLTGRVLATSQDVDDGGTVQNYVENTTGEESNIQQQGTNTAPTDYINDISNQLQNIASGQQPKDMRRQVAIMVIIIVTVLLIVGLITWYYMTNQ